MERHSAAPLPEASFRQATLLFWMFTATAGAMLAFCVFKMATGLPDLGTVFEDGDPIRPIAAAVFGLVAITQLVLGRIMGRQALRSRPPLADRPAAVAQLMTSTITTAAFMESIALYGLVVALIWRADVGAIFGIAGVLALLANRPRWSAWERHLRDTEARAL